MNANELADYLEKCISNDSDIYEQAATMLRQQQAEIKVLKAKTLTDEEIIEVWNVLEDTNSAEHDAKVFARELLRKAQEK